jgi:hypothetical protein
MHPRAPDNHVYFALVLAAAVALASTPTPTNLYRDLKSILFMGADAQAYELAGALGEHPELVVPP